MQTKIRGLAVALVLALALATTARPALALATYDDPVRYEDWNAQHATAQFPKPDAALRIVDAGGTVSTCSGALLASGQHVLTAAHCFTTFDTREVEVSFNTTGALPVVPVSPATVVVHPGWSGDFQQGVDLAVILLPAPVAGVAGYRLARQGPIGPMNHVELRGWGPGGRGAMDAVTYPFGTLRHGFNHYDAQLYAAQLYLFDFDDYVENGVHNFSGEPGWITLPTDPPIRSIIHIDHENDGLAVLGEATTTRGDSGGATVGIEIGLVGIHSAGATSTADTQFVDLDGDGASDDQDGDGAADADSSFGEVGFDTPIYLHASWIDCVTDHGPTDACDVDGDCDIDVADRDAVFDANNSSYGEADYRWGADRDRDGTVGAVDFVSWEANCQACGDGTQDPGETCDDGNLADGDGCSSACDLEDEDGDGVANSADDFRATANADQRDTDADGYGNACDPDLDGDGAVGLSDFNAFRRVFGLAIGDPGYDADADLTGDGAIGLPDVNVLRSYFGGPPGPSGLACAGAVPCP